MANFRLHYFSQALRMTVGVNVIIPEDAWGCSLADRPAGCRYPVLWLQAGGGYDHTDWQRYTALELYAAEADVAIVCSGAYCSGYMDTRHGDFRYFTQLSVETPRVVRHLFPLSEDPRDNFIAGFSAGGYGSLKWMLREPERFAAFGLFSGNVNMPMEMMPEFEDKTAPFFMFAAGFGNRADVKDTPDDIWYLLRKQTAAGVRLPEGYIATGVEDDHYEENIRSMDIYEAMGLRFQRIIDHGRHNWEYCQRHVREFLIWLNERGYLNRPRKHV